MSGETANLKGTALTDLHISLGAKMVPFAGFNMPVLYTNLIQEHHTVRNGVGVFDVSHMGEFYMDRFRYFMDMPGRNIALTFMHQIHHHNKKHLHN